jgi:hypothetical protein
MNVTLSRSSHLHHLLLMKLLEYRATTGRRCADGRSLICIVMNVKWSLFRLTKDGLLLASAITLSACRYNLTLFSPGDDTQFDQIIS